MVQLVGARALAAGLERSQNWLWRTSFRALRSLVLSLEQIVPNYAKKVFNGDDVIVDVTGWPQSSSLYSCLGEVGSGSKLQGQCLVNKCQYHNCLSKVIHAKRRSQWITLFEIAGQRSTLQAYWVTLALISNIANYLKYNYFWDCDGIDNVTLRLSKFSDFCSRHTVAVAGDDIMFHILVTVSGHTNLPWKSEAALSCGGRKPYS